MRTPTLKIILADDHTIIREGLKSFLRTESGIEVIGEASNGEELVLLASKCRADLYITDIKMPHMCGIEATKQIIKKQPGAKVLAFTFLHNEYSVIDMLRAGALGYIVKNAERSELMLAIKTVASGQPYVCEYTTPTLSSLIHQLRPEQVKTNSGFPLFEEKERVIIDLICQGKTSKEIAETIHLSCRTIEGYRLQLLKKTNTRNTAELIIYAVKSGLHRELLQKDYQ